MKQEFLAKFSALVCMGAMVGLLGMHTDFWIFKELGEGGHVLRDFHRVGMTLTPGDRLVGFIIQGAPLGFFGWAFYKGMILFWRLSSLPKWNQAIMDGFYQASKFAAIGAVLMVVYPTVLSLAFSATEPAGQRVILFSITHEGTFILVCSGLFYSLAYSLRKSFSRSASA